MLKIQKTTNYSQFKFYEDENRAPRPKTLIDSIQRKNMLEEHPIICDIDMYVIDGQNRLKAAEELKLPIYYIVSENISKEDIAICQNQSPWQMYDFLKYFKNKNADYKFLSYIVEKYKFPIHVVVSFCAGHGGGGKSFKQFRHGDFKITKELIELEDKFRKIYDLSQDIESINLAAGKRVYKIKAKTFEALWDIINMPGYDHKKLINQINSRKEAVLEAQGFDSRESIRNSFLKRIYDFHMKNRIYNAA